MINGWFAVSGVGVEIRNIRLTEGNLTKEGREA
jgi:hypothetical protein